METASADFHLICKNIQYVLRRTAIPKEATTDHKRQWTCQLYEDTTEQQFEDMDETMVFVQSYVHMDENIEDLQHMFTGQDDEAAIRGLLAEMKTNCDGKITQLVEDPVIVGLFFSSGIYIIHTKGKNTYHINEDNTTNIGCMHLINVCMEMLGRLDADDIDSAEEAAAKKAGIPYKKSKTTVNDFYKNAVAAGETSFSFQYFQDKAPYLIAKKESRHIFLKCIGFFKDVLLMLDRATFNWKEPSKKTADPCYFSQFIEVSGKDVKLLKITPVRIGDQSKKLNLRPQSFDIAAESGLIKTLRDFIPREYTVEVRKVIKDTSRRSGGGMNDAIKQLRDTHEKRLHQCKMLLGNFKQPDNYLHLYYAYMKMMHGTPPTRENIQRKLDDKMNHSKNIKINPTYFKSRINPGTFTTGRHHSGFKEIVYGWKRIHYVRGCFREHPIGKCDSYIPRFYINQGWW